MKKTILSFLLIGSAGLAIAQQQPPTSHPDKNKINNNNTNLNNTPATNPNYNNQQYPNRPPVNQPPTNANQNPDSNVTTDPTYNPMTTSPETNSAARTTTTTTYQIHVPASIQTSFSISYPGVTANMWSQSGDWYVSRYVENGRIMQVSYREDGKILTATMSPIKKSFVPDEVVSQAIQRYGANLYAIGSSKGTDGQEMYNVTLIENGQARTEWMNTDGTTAEHHFRTADEAAMSVDERSMNMQEQTEVTNQDSSANQAPVTDSTSVNEERVTPQPEHAHPQDQNQDEENNSANQEGINNASELNTSPRRL
jgi:hypothetical protein